MREVRRSRKREGGGTLRADVSFLDLWRQLNADPRVSHGYETLFSSLEVLGANRPLSSTMITSSRPMEDKTTVTVTLALLTPFILAGTEIVLGPQVRAMLTGSSTTSTAVPVTSTVVGR